MHFKSTCISRDITKWKANGYFFKCCLNSAHPSILQDIGQLKPDFINSLLIWKMSLTLLSLKSAHHRKYFRQEVTVWAIKTYIEIFLPPNLSSMKKHQSSICENDGLLPSNFGLWSINAQTLFVPARKLKDAIAQEERLTRSPDWLLVMINNGKK